MATYRTIVNLCKATTTATASLGELTDTIDIHDLINFSIQYQNLHTAIGFTCIQAKVGVGDASDLTVANSAYIPYPSALGATAMTITTAIDNAYKWIKFYGTTSQTMAMGNAKIIIAGNRRSY